ncbi:M35 family metallo-endopeptidase [Pseudoroseomonas ludipueritiae]|uniref:Lysine-specific metallo-endopeptidase domain-containing protein n=1 Tax=Pseudoroseomonas ludipueritiae TaxID=198093 RepID=A0ABR7R302_9PROT|nr:M35 family metallo-endopeptidase [Pseudoroseomonas ludipueritiae]MBC9176135.1 hypothetical protein [Pseudoroseomonas ludipueritiae]
MSAPCLLAARAAGLAGTFLVLVPAVWSDSTRADIVSSQRPCTTQQRQAIDAAIAKARQGLQKATEALKKPTEADTDRFTRWFGAPSSDAAESVRHVYERALTMMNFQSFWCPIVNSDELQWSVNEVAAIWPPTPTAIYLAPYFFDMATTGADSRAGTIIHELTHQESVGGTKDVEYGQEKAKAMAQNNPSQARRNADNYQYYAEDLLFGLQ